MTREPLASHELRTPHKLTAGTKPAAETLRIGEAHDRFEQEADRVADAVMSRGASGDWSFARTGINTPLQRKCSCGESAGAEGECEECKKKQSGLQRKAASPDRPGEVPESVHEVLNSPGIPLEDDVRRSMERRFGYDFSRVRIHADDQAAKSAHAVNAFAYTVGRHIAFAAGQYSPHTTEGSRLIAHELTHNIQQGGASVRNPRIANDDAAEQEAQQAATRPSASRQVAPRPGQFGRLARQGPGAGQPSPVPLPKVDQPEDEFKDIGHSREYGRLSSWGWGAPETNNIYQQCVISPLERDKFKAFVKTLPAEQTRGRKKPLNAEEVLGITSYNAGNAKPPEINATPVQDNGKTVYKLKPTHAEMPPIRSAYTQTGSYVEGFQQDTTEECRGERIRTGTSKFPINWTLTAEGAAKTLEAEQEHCNDIRAAFDLTLGLYASVINNLAASERTYSKSDDAIKEAVKAAGVGPDAMIYKFHEMALKTKLRDDSDWHTAQPIGDKAKKDHPKKVGCQYFFTLDGTCFPQVGNHGSREVIGMTKAAKPAKPTGQP
jgi:hypothetical protein